MILPILCPAPTNMMEKEMTYIQGFVTAVPTAKRQAFVEHARKAAELMREAAGNPATDGAVPGESASTLRQAGEGAPA